MRFHFFFPVCMLFIFLLFLHWAEPLVCWIEEVRKNAGLVILSPLSIRLAIGLHGRNLLKIILRKWHLMSSLLILFPFLIKNIGFCQILYLHLLRSLYGFLWKSVGMVRHIAWFFWFLNQICIFRINLKLWGIYTLYIFLYISVFNLLILKILLLYSRETFFTIFVLNFIFFCSHFIYFLLLLICSSVCSFCHTPWFWAQNAFALASVILENEVKVAQSCPPLCNSMDYSHQAPLSMDFSRQEKTHWSGFPFPSPGDLPDPGTEPKSPALESDSLLSEPQRKQIIFWPCHAACRILVPDHILNLHSLQ